MTWRIGVDLGGTKIEVAALDDSGVIRWRRRAPTPAEYGGIVTNIGELVRAAEAELSMRATVGVGIPGVVSPVTGLVKNANSLVLIGHPLDKDLGAALDREVRVENDANCFALSEAVDGAGAGCRTVFGVIIGTGCGGGVIVDGGVVEGRNRIAGEWGHTPLPWPEPDELPLTHCWCGQMGCLELYVSGPGLARTCDGPGARDASTIPARAAAGDTRAQAALDRHVDRLARGLAVVCNILDPDVIVLGGGLSNMAHLYAQVPPLMVKHMFSDVADTPIRPNVHGDSGGVRGAAWLWPQGR